MKKSCFAFLVAACASVTAFADDIEFDFTEHAPTPIQIALCSPLELPPATYNVYGIRANLLFVRSYVTGGLDVGLSGFTRNDFMGLSLQGFNWVDGDAMGIQAAALLNLNKGEVRGIQLAPLNVNNITKGASLGCLNWMHGVSYGLECGVIANANLRELYGVSCAPINYAQKLEGGQLGLFNIVYESSRGCQLGLFNSSADHEGVQIGLININGTSVLPIFPFFNANF